MTIERNLLVGLDEIKSVVLQCEQCKSRMVISPDKMDTYPGACPRGHVWHWDTTPGREAVGTQSVGFVVSLKNLRSQTLSNAGFKLMLEFMDPKE